MVKVSKREAMRDVSKFLRDIYVWCDQDGRYDTGAVSCTRKTIKAIRRVMDSIIEADANDTDIRVPEGYDSVYAMLRGQR